MPITIPSQIPLIGGATIGGDDSQTQTQAPPDTSARDTYIAVLAAQHKGQIGQAAPQYVQGTGSNQGSKFPTGYDLYTFGDGTTIEATPDGKFQNYKESKTAQDTSAGTGNKVVPITNADGTTTQYNVDPRTNTATPVQGLPTSAAKPTTPQDALAQQGIYVIGNQVYTKNPTPNDGRGPYVLSDATQAQQQLSDAKTVADTQYQAAQTKKLDIDNQLAADPTNQALKQQAAQADIAFKAAQTNAQNATAARDAIQNQVDLAKLQPQIAQIGAQTQASAGQAAQSQAQAAAITAKTPAEIAELTSRAKLGDAQAIEALARAAQPSIQQTGQGPTYTYWDPTTQKMVTAQNPAYQPTDPGRLEVQLNQQAQSQYQQLQQQVAQGKLTPDQAGNQFDQWWSANIDPLKGDIAAARAKQQQDLATAATQQQYYQAQAANLPATLANTASDQAQRNVISMMPYMVNSSAATTPGVTTGAGGWPTLNAQQVNANATFSLPNLQEIGRQGAAAALANISPTAQAHLNTPGPVAQPQAMPDMLNMSNYTFGAAGGTPPAGAAPGPTADQLANQNAAGNQIVNLGAFSGAMPGAGGSGLLPAGMAGVPGLDTGRLTGAQNPVAIPAGTFGPLSGPYVDPYATRGVPPASALPPWLGGMWGQYTPAG